jgi:hypothetical protein
MSPVPYKVLFIAGSGRSGTTLLNNILGQLPDFFAAGELRELWDRGVVKNRQCGCGTPFHACPTWNAIIQRAFGGFDLELAQEMSRQIESFRIAHLPRTLVPAFRPGERGQLAELLEHLHALYEAIAEVTGCRVIVDSSKNAAFGYLLTRAGLPGLDVLHVVREAAATAYSWGQRKEFEPGHLMRRRPPYTAAAEWDAHNLATELFLAPAADRYRRLRYEDFIAAPRGSVIDILHWLEETTVDLPFTSELEVDLARDTHAVFGNAVRFQRGLIELHRDDRWRTQMPPRDLLTVTALTGPLRWWYGYPLDPRANGSSMCDRVHPRSSLPKSSERSAAEPTCHSSS